MGIMMLISKYSLSLWQLRESFPFVGFSFLGFHRIFDVLRILVNLCSSSLFLTNILPHIWASFGCASSCDGALPAMSWRKIWGNWFSFCRRCLSFFYFGFFCSTESENSMCFLCFFSLIRFHKFSCEFDECSLEESHAI